MNTHGNLVDVKEFEDFINRHLADRECWPRQETQAVFYEEQREAA